MTPDILVAGVGNVFLRDDGFGVEVARHLLATGGLPDGVAAADFGVRGLHLAYELLDGYDTLILVDAAPRDEPPGTVYLIEAELSTVAPIGGMTPAFDAHTMTPEVVLGTLAALRGGSLAGGVPVGGLRRAFVIGCQPADVSPGMGLTPAVAAAVEIAADSARRLAHDCRRQVAVPRHTGPAQHTEPVTQQNG